MVVEISQRNSTTAWTASPTKRGIFCLLLGVMYAVVTQRNNRHTGEEIINEHASIQRSVTTIDDAEEPSPNDRRKLIVQVLETPSSPATSNNKIHIDRSGLPEGYVWGMLEDEDCLFYDPSFEQLLVGESDIERTMTQCIDSVDCDFLQIMRNDDNEPFGVKLQKLDQYQTTESSDFQACGSDVTLTTQQASDLFYRQSKDMKYSHSIRLNVWTDGLRQVDVERRLRHFELFYHSTQGLDFVPRFEIVQFHDNVDFGDGCDVAMERLQQAILQKPGDYDIGVYFSEKIGDDGEPCLGRFLGAFTSDCYDKPAIVSLFDPPTYTSDFHEMLHAFGFDHEESKKHSCPMKAYKGESFSWKDGIDDCARDQVVSTLPINQCIRRYADDQPNPCSNGWGGGKVVFTDRVACTRTQQPYCDAACALAKCDQIGGSFDETSLDPFTCYVQSPTTVVDSSCDFPSKCDLQEFESPPDVNSWNETVAFCQDKGLELASYSDICPCGEHRGPFFGKKEGNHWVAANSTIGDKNTWIQVGDSHNTCLSFSQLYGGTPLSITGPDWGIEPTSSTFEGSNFVYCCKQ